MLLQRMLKKLQYSLLSNENYSNLQNNSNLNLLNRAYLENVLRKFKCKEYKNGLPIILTNKTNVIITIIRNFNKYNILNNLDCLIINYDINVRKYN